MISIHALREEGDSGMRSGALNRSNFYPRPPRGGRLSFWWSCIRREVISIHALREEGDPEEWGDIPLAFIFLSTPSARRATFPVCILGST